MGANYRKGIAESSRQRIKTTVIIDKLQAHVEGKLEMTRSQIHVALALLKKTLPDLVSIEAKGSGPQGVTVQLISYARQFENYLVQGANQSRKGAVIDAEAEPVPVSPIPKGGNEEGGGGLVDGEEDDDTPPTPPSDQKYNIPTFCKSLKKTLNTIDDKDSDS